MRFQPGETVANYRILEEVGSGGAGRVFRVEHVITQRREAMKVLAGGRPGTHEEAQRFLREIQLQASLNHPNIAAVHNALWVDDDLVMVMELVEGQSLRQVLEARRLSLEESLGIARQVLSALACAHADGVVHRDVSPANIIVAADGTVKLTDFGLARAFADLRITQTGAVIGSLHYISPEQVRAAETADARTDIYSCGVVLYEMVAGRRPFESDSAFSLMRAHVEEAPPPPAAVDPELSAELNDVILKALAKEPARRFQTADEFRESLQQASAPAPPVHPSGATVWPVRRTVALGASAAGALLVVAALLGSVRWGDASKPTVPDLVVVTAPAAAPQPEPLPAAEPQQDPVETPVMSIPSEPPQKAPRAERSRPRPPSGGLRPAAGNVDPPPAPPTAATLASVPAAPKEGELPPVLADPPPGAQAVTGGQFDPQPAPVMDARPEEAPRKRNRLWRALGRVKALNPARLKQLVTDEESRERPEPER